ncbi:MAG: hypothetical protein FJ280_22550 [Planctomycetes bacterium]|nr:hypothetical protein [Planctomycetota bacterium]
MKISMIIAALVFLPVIAAARIDGGLQGPPAGNWAMVERLDRDTPVTLRLKAGDSIQGAFVALEAESVQMLVDGQERRFPRGEVAEIGRRGQANRKRNAMWGALIGFGVGFPAGYFLAPYIGDDDDMPNSEQAKGGAAFGAIWAGIGAGLGALTGGTHEVVIYRAR